MKGKTMRVWLNMGFDLYAVLKGTPEEIANKVEGALLETLGYPVKLETKPSEIARDLERTGTALIQWRDLTYTGFGREYENGIIEPVTDEEPERGPEIIPQGFGHGPEVEF